MAESFGHARAGLVLAATNCVGFKSLGEIKAYRAARAFKLEVYRLIKSSAAAHGDHRYRSQIFEAASSVEINIIEGFGRYTAGEFTYFLRVAHASLDEATGRLQDGIDREYFNAEACQPARALANEAGRLITGLITSLQPFIHTPRRNSNGPATPSGRKPSRP